MRCRRWRRRRWHGGLLRRPLEAGPACRGSKHARRRLGNLLLQRCVRRVCAGRRLGQRAPAGGRRREWRQWAGGAQET